MPRTTRQVIDAIAKDQRFTRAEVEEMQSEVSQMVENAGAWIERFNTIADAADLDIDTDGLADIKDPVNDSSRPFRAVAQAIETLHAATDLARGVVEVLEEFTHAWSAMEGYAETWLDEAADRDERAEAREELIGCADELSNKLADVDAYSIDLADIPG
ncbi:hypothetical protein [Nocardia sp. NPDC050435]|uniref:hypothetical protein n=1 Tax=Nocardia sp. NPDC050435 TaxID=3155040 RepID=UPI0033F801BD